MFRNLHNLNQFGVRIASCGEHSRLLEGIEIVAVEFVSVTVALRNDGFAVNLFRKEARTKLAFVGTQPHSATL